MNDQLKSTKRKTTADRLKMLMHEKNIRQADIVKMCAPYAEKYHVKIGRNDISQYIAGKVEPGQTKLFVLAKALNVSEAWLMGYNVPSQREDEDEKEFEYKSPDHNILIMRGRDGSYVKKRLTDEEVQALKVLVSQMEDVPDDI